ncbi:hypothetical protein KI387_036311, partial [Taxus chinensis]
MVILSTYQALFAEVRYYEDTLTQHAPDVPRYGPRRRSTIAIASGALEGVSTRRYQDGGRATTI